MESWCGDGRFSRVTVALLGRFLPRLERRPLTYSGPSLLSARKSIPFATVEEPAGGFLADAARHYNWLFVIITANEWQE
jgi:hypothetical protein